MTKKNIAVVILAAGQGTRMKSTKPKVLHEIGGRTMLAHVIDAAQSLSPERTILVVSKNGEPISNVAKDLMPDIAVAIQDPPKGTAHAVEQALPALQGFSGTVLVLYADTPLIEPATLESIAKENEGGATVSVLGFTPDDPRSYGRLKQNADGSLAAIVEAKDASPEELKIRLCNSGVMAIDSAFLQVRLKDIDSNNAKGEYYLTDLVGLAVADKKQCSVVEAGADEVLGVNSRVELAEAESIFQNRMRKAAMSNGATLIDPDTVYFSHDTKLGKDVVIEPHVVFASGVRVADHVEIKAYSHLEGATLASNVIIGPFARLRPGTDLKEGSKVGNFVETKKAVIGPGAKVNHLSYIGDAEVGAKANIGAGTITCNYDGHQKYKTTIGEGAFIGSNSALVAPVKIGDGAYVGSGSVITKDVAGGDLAVARGRQTEIKGWAFRFQKSQDKKK